MRSVVLAACAFVVGIGLGYWLHSERTPNTPMSMESCVLDHLRPGMTNEASEGVALACRNLYRSIASIRADSALRNRITARQRLEQIKMQELWDSLRPSMPSDSATTAEVERRFGPH